MHTYTLQYQFKSQPRTHSLELHQPSLTVHDAAMHLLQLHFGDGENSLIMPSADATPAQILQQAERVGLTDIEIIAGTADA